MRLNAYLARAGVASRRKADELIKAGRVTVNGAPGQLNTFVESRDRVEVDGEPVATFTLLLDDPKFWGERPPDAVYLHKLAVRRAYAGRGLGARIVDWVDGEARRLGRPFVDPRPRPR